MKHILLLVCTLCMISLSALEVEIPIPSGTLKQIPLGENYYHNLSSMNPEQTPIDTIDLGKYGKLLTVALSQVPIMEDEGTTLLVYHQSPAGQSLKVGPSADHWGCDTVGNKLGDMDSVFWYLHYYFEEGSWADTTSNIYFPLWQYSHELGNVQDPYEESLLWGNATMLIEAEDGDWIKLRFTENYLQYITTESETGEFPKMKNFLGTKIPLGPYYPEWDFFPFIYPYAFDDTTKETLLYLEYGLAYTVRPDTSRILDYNANIWRIISDTVTGIYSIKWDGAIDMEVDWLLDYRHHTITKGVGPYFDFGENNSITIDSLNRDSLWGVNIKILEESRTKHEVMSFDTIALALTDTVITTSGGQQADTLNSYEIIDLFVGRNMHNEPVQHLQIHLMKDVSVSNIVEKSTAQKLNLHSNEKIHLLSVNGRVLKEFTATYENLQTTMDKMTLPSGMYILKSPHFTEKIRVK